MSKASGRQAVSGELQGKIAEWQNADLIDAATAQEILHFEAQRPAPQAHGASLGISLLGGLSVVCGVGTLIAFNWDDIPDGVKLATVGVLLLLSALLSFRWGRPTSGAEKGWLDVALILYSGLTLGGLALVSQIYEQDGEVWKLLLLWCLLSLPLLSRARSRFANFYWFAGWAVTLLSAGDDLSDLLKAIGGFGRDPEMGTMLLVWTASALLCVFLMHSGSTLEASTGRLTQRPRALIGRSLFDLHVIVLGAGASFVWLADRERFAPSNLALGVLAFAALWFSLRPLAPLLSLGGLRPLSALLGVGIFSFAVPAAIQPDAAIVAFFFFCGFWGLYWFFADRAGESGGVRLAIAFIAGRILVASFELFEDMRITGITLVLLGGASIYLARRSARGRQASEFVGSQEGAASAPSAKEGGPS